MPRTMAQRPPQIVAFGGGGFSMEAGNPLLDDYVLGLTGAARPEGVLPADGVGRRRPLHRALLPALRGRVRGQPRVAVPARPLRAGGRGRHRGAPARAGPHLRRRRQRREHARRLAGARARRGAAPGVAQGRRDVRAVGGLAVLVRRVADGVPRRAAAGARPRAAPVLQLRALHERAGAPRGVPPLRGRRDAPGLRGRRRRGAALPRRGAAPRRVLAPARERLPGGADRRRGRRDAAGDLLPGAARA